MMRYILTATIDKTLFYAALHGFGECAMKNNARTLDLRPNEPSMVNRDMIS